MFRDGHKTRFYSHCSFYFFFPLSVFAFQVFSPCWTSFARNKVFYVLGFERLFEFVSAVSVVGLGWLKILKYVWKVAVYGRASISEMCQYIKFYSKNYHIIYWSAVAFCVCANKTIPRWMLILLTILNGFMYMFVGSFCAY